MCLWISYGPLNTFQRCWHFLVPNNKLWLWFDMRAPTTTTTTAAAHHPFTSHGESIFIAMCAFTKSTRNSGTLRCEECERTSFRFESRNHFRREVFLLRSVFNSNSGIHAPQSTSNETLLQPYSFIDERKHWCVLQFCPLKSNSVFKLHACGDHSVCVSVRYTRIKFTIPFRNH